MPTDDEATPLDQMHESLLRARQLAGSLAERMTGSRRASTERLAQHIDSAVGTLHGLAVELAQWSSERSKPPRKRDGFAFDVLATLDASLPDPRRAYVLLPGLWHLRDKRVARFCIPGRNAALESIDVAWPDGAVSQARVAIIAWRLASAEFRLAAAARHLHDKSRWKGLDERDLAVDENALLEWDATGTPVPVRSMRAGPQAAPQPLPPSAPG